MDIESENDEFKYCPPQNKGLESLIEILSPSLGNEFLLFDTNGLEYVASGIVDPIHTGLPLFPTLEAYRTIEFIGRYGSGKSMIAYSIIAQVVSPKSIGGMECPVVIFDMDRKLNLDNLVKSISFLITSLETSEERSKALYESAGRVIVYQPKDIIHFSLLVCALQDNIYCNPRLIVVDSLSSFLYDLTSITSLCNNILQRTLRILSKTLREKKASMIVISPETLRNNASMFYYPSFAWGSCVDDQIYFKPIYCTDAYEPEYRILLHNVSNPDYKVQFRILSTGIQWIS